MASNVKEDICYPQPTTFPQRVAIANDFVTRFHFPLPLAVDAMDNAADHAYSGWPERIYIIDEQGKIVYRGGLGPFNYRPEEARAWLAQRFPPATSSASLAASPSPSTRAR
jgi:Iodothyronine deiodinase